MRRTMRFMIAALAAGGALLPGVRLALADGFDGERFRPAAGAAGGLLVERPLVPVHLGFGLGVFVGYANDAVVYRNAAGPDSTPLHDAMSLDLLASIGLFKYGELAVHVPLRLVYDGDPWPPGAATPELNANTGIGDVRIVPKVTVLRIGAPVLRFALGLAVPVTLPTGSENALRGSGTVTAEPRILLGVYVGNLGLVANGGVRLQGDEGLRLGHEVTFGAAATYALPFAHNLIDLQADVMGGYFIQRNASTSANLPLEVLAGAILKPHPRWNIYAAGGMGLVDGIGAPDWRVVAGVRFARGVPGKGGQPDSDGDGVVDAEDSCPDQPEDLDGFEDEDGCPDEDNDKDGIPDDNDECPDDAEEPGGNKDGCPDKARVVVRKGRMVVYGKVQFGTGSTDILPQSEQLIDEMATALKDHPEIAHVQIEGHTDSTGDDDVNQKLSEGRAESVRQAIIKRGVSPDRLSIKGLGESEPVAPNETRAGRAKNRRVEFTIK